MIDFTTYKREQDAAEAAYDAERAKRGEMTPDEFDALVAKAEKFHGEHLNKGNLDRYETIRSLMNSLMEIPGSVKASEEAPSPNREHATIHLYLSDVYGTKSKNLFPFVQAINLADEFTISTSDDPQAAIQLSWTVYDIYEK